ncbi:MAG: antitoxin Xre/MbcA/ParS toxin-binding domain-containing protein [Pseudodonghicola sp.]
MHDMAVAEDAILARTVELLGGEKAFKAPVTSRLDAHDLLRHGLPVAALNRLLKQLPFLALSGDDLEHATGMSLRTYQRRREATAKPLNLEQSNRTWKFAEILARAIEIFGSQETAVDWMTRPAIGLDQRRPMDLIGTAAGVELVEDYLTRIDYGIYT